MTLCILAVGFFVPLLVASVDAGAVESAPIGRWL